MVAPRALLVLGNPDMVWLADESGYVSCRAAHEVWKAFGIADRFGFSFVAGHGHCQLPNSQRPEVEAFVDKFLLGKSTENTDVTISQYGDVDHNRWVEWWGTGVPKFPKRDMTGIETIALEAETATVGSNWQILPDEQASNGFYVAVKPGIQSIPVAAEDIESSITMPFSVTAGGSYAVHARLNCPSPDDDSFWIKMDDGEFQMLNNLGTRGWDWGKLNDFRLQAGDHILTITYREDGAKLDKIRISNDRYAPEGMGEPASELNPGFGAR